jgi:hypothetical protein
MPSRILKAYGRFASLGPGRTKAGVELQTVRLTTGSITNGTNSSVTVTWPSAFASTSYTVVAGVEDSTAGLGLQVEHIVSRTTTGCVIRVKNNGTGALTGTLHVVGISD